MNESYESRIFKRVFWRQAFQNFLHNQGLDSVTILAYTSLVGLVPFLAVMMSVFSMSTSFEVFKDVLMDKVVHHLLPSATPMVEAYLLSFSQQATQLQGIGLLVMLVTALILLWTIDRKINSMWGTQLQRRWWVSLLNYLGISLVGPILIGGSFVLSSFLLAAPIVVDIQLDTLFVNQLPIVINVLGFLFLYRFVPIKKVNWVAALTGALLTAVEIEFLKSGFTLYVRWFPTYSLIYGAFAAIPLFLLWLYVLWFIIIFNASVVYQVGVKRTN